MGVSFSSVGSFKECKSECLVSDGRLAGEEEIVTAFPVESVDLRLAEAERVTRSLQIHY